MIGAGLAAEAAATLLAARLRGARPVLLIETGSAPQADAFYGTILGPWAKPVHDAAGVTEEALLREGAALSWGTRYAYAGEGADPAARRAWVQCHVQPFAAPGGVELQHVLTRLGLPLQPLLLPAVAGAAGTFAHPSPDPRSPLSRAEYGYQAEPASLARAFAAAGAASGVRRLRAGIGDVVTREGEIAGLTLSDGTSVEADLYVDATGPDARLLSRLGDARRSGQTVRLLTSETVTEADAPVRDLTITAGGWTALTSVRGRSLTMTATRPEDEAAALRRHGTEPVSVIDAALGQVPVPWIGNAVAVGHAALVADPLTPAALHLLYRDLTRLNELIPLGREQTVERREYARRFADDAEHAGLFVSALSDLAPRGLAPHDPAPHDPASEGGGYWDAARDASPKLRTKLGQFESRGVLVQYDLEPFHREDWLILYEGQGRRPRRYDRLADRLDEGGARRDLGLQARAIADLAARMPPAARYTERYLDYLGRET